jgi:ABC-2 type transport system ATP-binding protein
MQFCNGGYLSYKNGYSVKNQKTKSVIKLEGITKYYGSQRILTGIDLEIKKGEILGIVGPNGSGKSTLLKIVLGLVYHTEGFLSYPAGAVGIRTGALLDKPGFFPGFSLEKNLVIFSGGEKAMLFDEITERLGLKQYLDKKFSNCSTGIQKRCELAAALMRQPELLVMDEPISGLDPAGVYAFRSVMRELQATHCAILLTDHALKEMEMICTRVCFMRQGIIQAILSMKELHVRFNDIEEAYRFYNLKIS